MLYCPAFAGSDHVHSGALARENVRAYVVVGKDDRELGLGLPVEREVEIAREDLPMRHIVEFDDVSLGMGFGLPSSSPVVKVRRLALHRSSVWPPRPGSAWTLPQCWARLSSPHPVLSRKAVSGGGDNALEAFGCVPKTLF